MAVAPDGPAGPGGLATAGRTGAGGRAPGGPAGGLAVVGGGLAWPAVPGPDGGRTAPAVVAVVVVVDVAGVPAGGGRTVDAVGPAAEPAGLLTTVPLGRVGTTGRPLGPGEPALPTAAAAAAFFAVLARCNACICLFLVHLVKTPMAALAPRSDSCPTISAFMWLNCVWSRWSVSPSQTNGICSPLASCALGTFLSLRAVLARSSGVNSANTILIDTLTGAGLGGAGGGAAAAEAGAVVAVAEPGGRTAGRMAG